jgi:hypothetical protein
MTPRTTAPPPTARRITASEVGTFTFCQRACFLENEGEPTTLTDARDRGSADHATRASAFLQVRRRGAPRASS